MLLVLYERPIHEEYLQWVKQQTQHHPIAFEPMPNRDPWENVLHAKDLRSVAREQGAAFDEVWCVFDRLPDGVKERAAGSRQLRNIRVVDNTPSFELWLLFHFAEYDPSRDIQKQLDEFLPGYHGAMPGDGSVFAGRYEQARARALSLPPEAGRVDTYLLVDSVLKSFRAFKPNNRGRGI